MYEFGFWSEKLLFEVIVRGNISNMLIFSFDFIACEGFSAIRQFWAISHIKPNTLTELATVSLHS